MITSTTLGRLDTWAAVREFLFAGNATFTLKSLRTGVRFTYKFRVKKQDLLALESSQKQHDILGGSHLAMQATEVTYFANLLRGPDNEKDFAYMGVVRKPGRFFLTAASNKVSRRSPAHRGLVWMLDAMLNDRAVLGVNLEVWHEGRCGRCGRKLTVPESIAAGIGPECSGRVV